MSDPIKALKSDGRTLKQQQEQQSDNYQKDPIFFATTNSLTICTQIVWTLQRQNQEFYSELIN